MNFPSLTVASLVLHPPNVYPANVGAPATVTSAPYLYDTVPGNDGAPVIAGSFVYS